MHRRVVLNRRVPVRGCRSSAERQRQRAEPARWTRSSRCMPWSLESARRRPRAPAPRRPLAVVARPCRRGRSAPVACRSSPCSPERASVGRAREPRVEAVVEADLHPSPRCAAAAASCLTCAADPRRLLDSTWAPGSSAASTASRSCGWRRRRRRAERQERVAPSRPAASRSADVVARDELVVGRARRPACVRSGRSRRSHSHRPRDRAEEVEVEAQLRRLRRASPGACRRAAARRRAGSRETLGADELLLRARRRRRERLSMWSSAMPGERRLFCQC